MKMKSLLKIFLLATLYCSIITAQNPRQSIINSGNITSWVRDDGFHDWVVSNSWNGSYPKGINVGVIFSEGIIWGGLVHDGRDTVVRVAGNEYWSNNIPLTRLYRVRSDYFSNINLVDDAADFFHKSRNQVTDEDIQTIYKQYEKDWNEWPAEEGAPFYDKNNNGIYEQDIDVPGVPGAVQTLFIKYSDGKEFSLWKSPPIGLEVSETYWAYYPSGILSNVIFKKVNIIYKGLSSTPQMHKLTVCTFVNGLIQTSVILRMIS
ncbi:hypothetical protein ABRY23_11065 [Melioribacteraceae bacterium 4301-Me]|uniref:hypothetical protein n=1 Tax=Pyranulibacter aquaticus TaxID=3163344 RepID=UPI0035998644